jgi:hypothetical protein
VLLDARSIVSPVQIQDEGAKHILEAAFFSNHGSYPNSKQLHQDDSERGPRSLRSGRRTSRKNWARIAGHGLAGSISLYCHW